ncbi:lipid A biosynthesis acyltransferase [Danxiaibacter flavus]|uniref:Lipid A biosynthesis acyltransferase n=1 Tax=Danxiaibacter flavus TaxID=3049108 RepID=A0ABV3ZKR0_9BACT|nr:lipid A biosynthesis acyltransferase [Chitinophagaceae bacterium DXS]
MYYVVYGLLYLFSLLPFWFMYLLSDGIYLLLYYVIKYRRDVVMGNLAVAFPDKSEEERVKIAKEFYKSFVDQFIETVKMLSMSRKELDKRFTSDYHVVNDLYSTGKNIQFHLGHCFNWEYATLAFSANITYPLVTVYMPIQNKIFNKIFYDMRSRFGGKLVAATDFRNEFRQYSRGRFGLALVADQSPGGAEHAYWTNFFGRMTAFVPGPEKGAKLNNTAIIMAGIKKKKRGYYHCELKLLTMEPRSLPNGEITREMIRFIEDGIREQPSNYLWSHKRWKIPFDQEKFGHLVV